MWRVFISKITSLRFDLPFTYNNTCVVNTFNTSYSNTWFSFCFFFRLATRLYVYRPRISKCYLHRVSCYLAFPLLKLCDTCDTRRPSGSQLKSYCTFGTVTSNSSMDRKNTELLRASNDLSQLSINKNSHVVITLWVSVVTLNDLVRPNVFWKEKKRWYPLPFRFRSVLDPPWIGAKFT